MLDDQTIAYKFVYDEDHLQKRGESYSYRKFICHKKKLNDSILILLCSFF